MPYDPNLPTPRWDDHAPNWQPSHKTDGGPAWWSCSYCGFHESGNLTTDAESMRCAAHEYRCPKRPAGDVPTDYERAAYQMVHAAGLRDDIAYATNIINDKLVILRRTWFIEFGTRRSIRNEIKVWEGKIAGIHARALSLGLDRGWSDPNFTPRPGA